MNCHEVMELMQRDLDRDLIDSEHKAMMAHLQQCPDCAEMYSRLQQLSQELASLPKVAPPISLVDSILPQLAELDRAGESPFSVATSPAVQTIASAPIIPMQTERPQRRAKSAWSFAAAGGIVAAGLLLALFINDMDGTKVADDNHLLYNSVSSKAEKSAPAQQQNAATENSLRSDAKSQQPASALPVVPNGNAAGNGAETGMSGGAAKPTEIPADSAKAVDQRGADSTSQTNVGNGTNTAEPKPGTGSPNHTGNTGSANNAGNAGNAGNANNTNNTQEINKNAAAAAEGANSAGAASTEPVDTKKADVSGGQKNMGSANGAASSSEQQVQGLIGPPSPTSAQAQNQINSADKSADKGNFSQQPSTGDTFVNNKSSDTIEKTENTTNESSFDSRKSQTETSNTAGLLAVPPPAAQLISEDGLLIAMIDKSNRRVTVITADSRQTEMFISASWKEKDELKLLKWKGSAQLTYSVTSADGKTKTMVIDIAKQTESAHQP